jgi:hypothetical protein
VRSLQHIHVFLNVLHLIVAFLQLQLQNSDLLLESSPNFVDFALDEFLPGTFHIFSAGQTRTLFPFGNQLVESAK